MTKQRPLAHMISNVRTKGHNPTFLFLWSARPTLFCLEFYKFLQPLSSSRETTAEESFTSFYPNFKTFISLLQVMILPLGQSETIESS